MTYDIYNCLEKFLYSQSNVGHFNREEEWRDIENKTLEEIFENQDFIRDEIMDYIKHYFSGFLNKNLTVLDVGCSLGSLSFAFREIAEFVLGIDIEEEAIRCANLYKEYKGYTNTYFLVDNAITFQETKKLGEEFNLILLKDVLEHVKNKKNLKSLVDNMMTLVSGESIVYIEVPNYIFPFEPHLKIPMLPLSPKALLKLEAWLFRKLRSEKDRNFVEYLNIVSPFYIKRIMTAYGFVCFNPVEDIKLKKLFKGERRFSDRFNFVENLVRLLQKAKLNKLCPDILSKCKLYPTLQLLCIKSREVGK